jgi:FkbM family methyltransferase
MDLSKLREFASSPRFRRGQYRRRFWPLARRILNTVQAIGVENDGTLIFTHSEDACITYGLLARGEWQKEEVTKACRILSGTMKQNAAFVNVGANIGTTLIYAMQTRLFRSAVAFEPEPRNLRLLRGNLAVNDIINCTIVEAAVSSSAGTLSFELNPMNRGEHRVVQPGLADKRRETITVSAVRLDEALSERGIPPEDVAMLWIDTEGYEEAVLQGATKLLPTGVPLVIELWPRALEASRTLGGLIDLLTSFYGRFVDLSAASTEFTHISRLKELASSLHVNDGETDVLLLPS